MTMGDVMRELSAVQRRVRSLEDGRIPSNVLDVGRENGAAVEVRLRSSRAQSPPSLVHDPQRGPDLLLRAGGSALALARSGPDFIAAAVAAGVVTYMGSTDAVVTASRTVYAAPVGNGGAKSSDTQAITRNLAGHGGTVRRLLVIASADCVAGSAVVTVRQNGVDTTLTVTLAAGGALTASDYVHSFEVDVFDEIGIKIVTASGADIAYSWALELAVGA